MKLTAKEIASLVGGEISGDSNIPITGVAPLETATSSELSFLHDPKLLKTLSTTQAGVLILKKGTPYSQTAVYVENPQLAFAKILALIAKEKEAKSTGIHPTAVISESAKIGKGVSIGAHSVIESEVSIGDNTQLSSQTYVGERSKIGQNCKIYPQVVIREDCNVGNRVIIHSGAVIGSDGFGYATEGGIHHKIPQVGSVILEDDVELGANVTIDKATLGSTVVGKGTKVDNLVQIAHNVVMGQGCILVSQAGVAGSSTLGNYVTLAGQVGVVGHVRIGDRAIAAAQSGIPNDVPEDTIVFGSPARPIHEERKIQVIIGKLPKIYAEFRKIKKLLKFDQQKES